MIRFFKYALILIGAGVLLFFLLNVCFPLKINIPYSKLVVSDKGDVLHSFLSADEKWRMQTTLSEINDKLKKAFIFKEDKYFYWHPGVNVFAIARAAVNNMFYQRKTSGASTITMQVARLLYPATRTYFNKTKETFRALQLEWCFSKEEILQLYLNLVPYGGNIEGVKAASVLYFNCTPEKLSLAQVTALTVIPNRPVSLRIGKGNKKIEEARNKWLRNMLEDEIFESAEIHDALNEPLTATRQQAPKLIPHLAIRLKKLYQEKAIIKTNINVAMQMKAESITYNYMKRLEQKNIFNAAILIIDNKTRNVISYIGSNNYNDVINAGQVDGVTAVRSPGSALKPLVYATAFDMGYITPKTIIADVPVNYLGYSPENFNAVFNGNVTIEKSLATSLNIPAVKTLNSVGVNSFAEKLSEAGFEQVKKDKNKLGLSTILGGCGVRLEELTNLYATFASSGKYQKVNYLSDKTDSLKLQIISPAAAYMVTDILNQLIRPDLPNSYQNNYHVPKIAWKTGTSYGRRDAWSVGYNKRYSIGVWVGNFSGQGVPELTGADMATPLLFELFNAIDYNSSGSWFTEPADLSFRLVCSESGKIPADYCKHQVMDYFIPKVSSVLKCNHLKEVIISADEKTSYCTSCMPEGNYIKKFYPNPDPDLRAWFEAEHLSYQKIPPHYTLCARIANGTAPRITSPVNQKEYLIEKNNDEKLMLSCATTADVTDVYWYINDVFYAHAKTEDQLFFTPQPGNIKISCADDKGRNSNIWVTVKEY